MTYVGLKSLNLNNKNVLEVGGYSISTIVEMKSPWGMLEAFSRVLKFLQMYTWSHGYKSQFLALVTFS